MVKDEPATPFYLSMRPLEAQVGALWTALEDLRVIASDAQLAHSRPFRVPYRTMYRSITFWHSPTPQALCILTKLASSDQWSSKKTLATLEQQKKHEGNENDQKPQGNKKEQVVAIHNKTLPA